MVESNGTAAPPSALDEIWNVFDYSMDIFGKYISVPILIFGICGNIMSMVVFTVKRNQDRASASYLAPLAFFDFWNNCNGCYYWLVMAAPYITDGKFGRKTYGESDVGCWLGWFFNMFGMYMSGFIIVIFSIERCFAIWQPLKMAAILTPSLRRNAILSLLLLSPLYLIVLIAEYGYFHGDETTTKGCPLKPDTPTALAVIFWFVNVGLGSLIPCTLVLVFNILLLIGLRRGNKEMDHAKSESEKKAHAQERRALRNLMLVSFFYVIFMFPHGVFWSWTAGSPSEVPKVHKLALYSLNWASMNYCVNPILYCYSLPYYRESAVKVITCGLAGRQKKQPIKSGKQ